MTLTPEIEGLVKRAETAIRLGERTGSRGTRPENIYNVAADLLAALTTLRQALDEATARADKLAAELETVKSKLHWLQSVDAEMRESANKDAEHLLRPYLTTAAVFGITPDHKWNQSGTPFDVRASVHAVFMRALAAEALSSSQAGEIRELREALGPFAAADDPYKAPEEQIHDFSASRRLTFAHLHAAATTLSKHPPAALKTET